MRARRPRRRAAHDVGEPDPLVEPDRELAVAGAARRTGRAARRSAAGRPRGRDRVDARAARSPPSAAAGVPSATIRPWSMIPTRSASTSASSRYCVVRNTVTPSSRASRATSSQSAVRLCGSSPVVGSSRKSTRGRWTSASARSSRRFIPPGVAADLAVGRLGEPDAVEELLRRGAALGRGSPWSIVCRRRWSRPVSSGSSAASCSAAPITPRTFGPSRTTSKPATCAVPGRRRQQRRQHQHRRRLAGAVRPEEAVDLARLDAEVDPVDRARALLELADEALDDDAVVAALTLPGR